MNNIIVPLLVALLSFPVLADGPNPFDPRTGEKETRKEKKEKDSEEDYDDEEEEDE